MSELFAEGDLVEATDGERRVIERVQMNAAYKCLWIPLLGFTGNIAADGTLSGFTLTLIEKASPPLPTEPFTIIRAVYLPAGNRNTKQTHLTLLPLSEGNGESRWVYSNGISVDVRDLPRIKSFEIVAEPVDVTAKKVLERVREMYDGSQSTTRDVIKLVAKEFGVTS
jgi:hypothetical protein